MIRLQCRSLPARLSIFLCAGAALLLSACRDTSGKMFGLQEAADLGTVEIHFSKIIVHKKETKGTRTILWFFKQHGEGHALHVAKCKATVTLGIDANRISEDDIRMSGQRISLLLPPIEIIDFDFDPTHYSIEKYLSTMEKTSWLNANTVNITANEIEEAYRTAEEQVRHQLPYPQLVKMAQRRTALFFRQHLRKAGFEEIFISFKKGDLSQFADGDTK